jgi:hypothetical protein
MVDQVITFRHVFWNAETIDQAVNELLVCNWLTEIIQFRPDPVEIIQVASEGVAGLDRTMKLGLERLDMIQGIILIGICECCKGCCAGAVLVAARCASYHVGSVLVFDNSCQELGQ